MNSKTCNTNKRIKRLDYAVDCDEINLLNQLRNLRKRCKDELYVTIIIRRNKIRIQREKP